MREELQPSKMLITNNEDHRENMHKAEDDAKNPDKPPSSELTKYEVFHGSDETNPHEGNYRHFMPDKTPENDLFFLYSTHEPPKEPYPFVFSTYNDKLNLKDLEIIKATARFCVLNGSEEFLNQIKLKYGDDPKFAFLRTNHTLNSVLTDFMNQYEQILSKEFGPSTQFSGPLKASLMVRAFKRAEFRELQEELNMRMRETNKRTRLRFASYDWSKFEIRSTVKLSENLGDLPECLSFQDIKESVLSRSNTLFEEISNEPSGIRSKKKKGMNIRAAGETRLKRKLDQVTVREAEIKCPITGKMIPESQFDKHLKILLSDPSYKEERERFEMKHRLTNLSTSEVYENVKNLVESETQPLKRQKS